MNGLFFLSFSFFNCCFHLQTRLKKKNCFPKLRNILYIYIYILIPLHFLVFSRSIRSFSFDIGSVYFFFSSCLVIYDFFNVNFYTNGFTF